jgi:ankyrin repeat protein
LDQGASAQQQAANAFGIEYYPLHFACFFEREETPKLIERLLNHSAENRATANMAAERGRTPLHTAAIFNNVKAIETLLNYGAGINKITSDTGNTPLHDAAMKGHLESVDFLIKNGASANIKNKAGETPFMTALVHRQPIIACYLFNQGHNLNQEDFANLLKDAQIKRSLPYAYTILLELMTARTQQLINRLLPESANENSPSLLGRSPNPNQFFKPAKEEIDDKKVNTVDNTNVVNTNTERKTPVAALDH